MKKNINLGKIIVFYIVIPILIIALMYILLPIILNYPPNSIDNDLQKEIDGLTYTQQYVLNIVICVSVGVFILLRNTRKINSMIKKINKEQENKQKLLDNITKLCINTPIKIYFAQIVIPLITLPIIILIMGAELSVVFKISIIFIVFFSLSATMTYVLTQKEFKNLIKRIYEKEYKYENNIMNLNPKIRIKTKLIIELIPLIIVALVFTSILAYTMNSKTIGDLYYKIYNEQLNKEFNKKEFYNLQEIQSELEYFNVDNNVTKFIINKDSSYTTYNNKELSEFFVKYAIANQETNRTYDYYCIDREGTYVEINTLDGNKYLVGLMYDTNSKIFLYTLITSFILLLLIIFITLIYISTNLSKDINLITQGLQRIIKEKDLNKGLIVTTNDETGELTDAFNQIEKMTQENIKEINQKQELLIRQEKMSILGEMAGGMAHDINNPASAINMSINVLYNIDDKEEKKKILDNMKECTNRILAIVSSVRDQFRNIGETKKDTFYISEIFKNIEVVIHNQLTKYNCELQIDYSKEFKIYGEKNKLNQVLSNIIMNSILAYNENNLKGTIYIDINEDKDYNIIKIKDNAGGIPEDIKEKLFTKILTTRGTQGTGLGLYLAKSIIEDEFKGKIYFETKNGEGTTFYIKLKKVEE